ncbi:MAG: hypothetical protein ACAI34_06345, partial [Verrucomicrobium sp.]
MKTSASVALIALAFAGMVTQAAAQGQPAAAPAAATGSPGTPISADLAAKDGQVWGALVYASTKPKGEGAGAVTDTPEFPDLAKRLGKAFPYTNFEVLGQHTQVVFREYESWVVPSRDVFLKLDSKGTAPNGGLNLHLQFWQGQQVLVKTDTLLRPNSPLFIGGPKWRDGQLVFVLLLKK